MAVSKPLLPAGATVMTPLGPASVDDLRSGSEVLGVRDGEQAWGRIEKATDNPEPTAAIRLLSPGGEILVTHDSRIGTPKGLALAGSLRSGDRIELLEPPGLPQFRPPKWCPQEFKGITFALPTENGCAAELEPELVLALEGREADFSLEHWDRWMTIKINHLGDLPAWGWDDQAGLLSLLCAWKAEEKDPVEMRAILTPDSPIASLLIGALIGARQRFQLRWTPRFLPEEVRVTRDPAHWQAYLPITRALVESRPTVELTVAADRWLIYSGLSLVRST